MRLPARRHVHLLLGAVVLSVLGTTVGPTRRAILAPHAINGHLPVKLPGWGIAALVEPPPEVKQGVVNNSSSDVDGLIRLLEEKDQRIKDLEEEVQQVSETKASETLSLASEAADDDLFYSGMREEDWDAEITRLDSLKQVRLTAIAAKGLKPNKHRVRPNETVLLEGGKELRLCATAEQMGEGLVADVAEASLRVRAIIRRYFQHHDAEWLSRLPATQFCGLNFVMGTSQLKNGLGNEFYKGLNALALAIMLDRTMIWGEPMAQEGDWTGSYNTTSGSYGSRMLEEYIQYSRKMFSMEEVKQLWVSKGCTRPLVVRQLAFNVKKDARADIAHLCDDLRTWDVPVINFYDSVDSTTLQTLLRNQHPHIRQAAKNLLGEPLIPSSRPNLYGELLRAVIAPRPVIARAIERTLRGGPPPVLSVHLRQNGVNDDRPSILSTASCVRKALETIGNEGLPKVVVVSDSPEAREELAKELEGAAAVVFFNASSYLLDFPEEARLSTGGFYKYFDWGEEQRWVAVVDFFLAARATRAYISAGKQRIAATFAQLGAALAATYSYGPDAAPPSPPKTAPPDVPLIESHSTEPADVSSADGDVKVHVVQTRRLLGPTTSLRSRAFQFYSSFSAERLNRGLGPCCSAYAWRPFSGALSCGFQPPQCALTPLLPHTFYETEWATPHFAVRENEYIEKIGLRFSVTGALSRDDVEAYCSSEGKRRRHFVDVVQDLPTLTKLSNETEKLM